MDPLHQFHQRLSPEQSAVWSSLTSPVQIQQFLDSVPYSPEDRNRSPLGVLQDRTAHCLDGALFAAAALRQLGEPPLLLDLFPDPGMDDDHILVLYKRRGCYGAIAKSNFVGLRFREPVFRTPRELVLSYFDVFFNVNGIKTLRTYTRPYDISRLDKFQWLWDDAGATKVEHHLHHHLKRVPVISPEAAGELTPVDQATYQAHLSIANPDGLYKPRVQLS